jgi:hypothetical protein
LLSLAVSHQKAEGKIIGASKIARDITERCLAFFHQVSCRMRRATWASYDAIAKARQLLTWTDQILNRR